MYSSGVVRKYEIPPSARVRGEDAAGQARNDSHRSSSYDVTPDAIREPAPDPIREPAPDPIRGLSLRLA